MNKNNEKFPTFFELLQESDSKKTYKFSAINGIFELKLKYENPEDHASSKSFYEPEAELDISAEKTEGGIIFYYDGNDYQEDRKLLLRDFDRLCQKFDTELSELISKRNFIK